MNIALKHFSIHTFTFIVDANSQSATYLLTLLGNTVRLTKSTDLEYIRVIPTFTESRM
jgi:hypothetical protein